MGLTKEQIKEINKNNKNKKNIIKNEKFKNDSKKGSANRRFLL